MALRFRKHILPCLWIAILSGIAISCKEKKADTTEYTKVLSDLATQFNKNCPKDEPNGTKLESVSFADNTLTFRLSLSDQAITKVNLDITRDSLIQSVSGKLKKYLVKGNCNLEYKYISPNDSSSITIVPNELSEGENLEDK